MHGSVSCVKTLQYKYMRFETIDEICRLYVSYESKMIHKYRDSLDQFSWLLCDM